MPKFSDKIDRLHDRISRELESAAGGTGSVHLRVGWMAGQCCRPCLISYSESDATASFL